MRTQWPILKGGIFFHEKRGVYEERGRFGGKSGVLLKNGVFVGF